MLSLMKGLAKDRSFIVAAPSGQAYSPRFAQYAKLHDLPFRRFSLPGLLGLARLVRRENIVLIHSHGKGAGIYARLLGLMTGRPVVHTFHGFHYKHLSAVKRYVYLAVERILAHFTAMTLNVSASEQAACAEAGILRKNRNVIVPNGVVLRAARNPVARDNGQPWILVNVARHESEKGVDGVIRIAAALARMGLDVELWLIGDGEQSAYLKELAAQEGVAERIRFMGFRDDVAALLQRADIFVSASHGEGMPLTLLEAMAAGLPSVASDVVGNRDVVEAGRTGFLFALGNHEQGADAIAQLIANPSLYENCARTAQERARSLYSVDVMCGRIDSIYQKVIANS
jgi:glycosyltransferase involved in cell wall biosynthesis